MVFLSHTGCNWNSVAWSTHGPWTTWY